MDLQHAIAQWNTIRAEAERLKLLERQWRDYVAQLAFPNVKKGTHRVPVGNSQELKLVASMRREIESGPALEEAYRMATIIEPSLASRSILRWTPTLNAKEFDALPPQVQACFHSVIMLKPNTPQLTLEDKTK